MPRFEPDDRIRSDSLPSQLTSLVWLLPPRGNTPSLLSVSKYEIGFIYQHLTHPGESPNIEARDQPLTLKSRHQKLVVRPLGGSLYLGFRQITNFRLKRPNYKHLVLTLALER